MDRNEIVFRNARASGRIYRRHHRLIENIDIEMDPKPTRRIDIQVSPDAG